MKAQHGLGAKTVARFLGLIGDPYQWVHLRTGEVHTRSVGQLFAYVGVAGPGYNSRRDTSNGRQWNRDARTRLWVCVEKIATKPGSRYCDVYRAGRDRYEDKTHTEPCAACGVKGKPAQPGDPWRPGHQHAGALRLVMREVLRDLWTEARRLHQASGGMQVAA